MDKLTKIDDEDFLFEGSFQVNAINLLFISSSFYPSLVVYNLVVTSNTDVLLIVSRLLVTCTITFKAAIIAFRSC